MTHVQQNSRVVLRLICFALLSGVPAKGFSHPWRSADFETLNDDVVGRRSWLHKCTSFFGLLLTGASAGQPTIASAEESVQINAAFKVLMKVQLDKETAGEIEIEVFPEWAPLAASRFRELAELGFYNDARFFRVLPGYIAQFGIAADPALNKEWLFCESRCKALPDEPRKQPNKKGTLTFAASSGKNSRQTQVFINLNNNDGPPNFLDAQGFVPFARVTKGMDTVVNKINSEYGLQESLSGGLAGSVNQGKAAYFGKEYLDALFPKLSVIQYVKVI
jgi:peptidyl-prolyl cis-trans isomerase A (cyclophilin A)